MLIFNKR